MVDNILEKAYPYWRQSSWAQGIAEAYSAGLEDGREARDSREKEFTFQKAYSEGYSHGLNQYMDAHAELKEKW